MSEVGDFHIYIQKIKRSTSALTANLEHNGAVYDCSLPRVPLNHTLNLSICLTITKLDQYPHLYKFCITF